MKLQIIYNFYIADESCDNSVYQMHYHWLERATALVDKSIFIISYDGPMDADIVYRVKSKLISICKSKESQFIFESNDRYNREGIIFKKYIIDKLDKYDDYLTFFGHTKGVTNLDGLANMNNLLLWIHSMYFHNFNWLSEMSAKLGCNHNKYISYGGGYFKDYRHTNRYHWFYSGSFYWLNTKRLRQYIEDNNIDVDSLLTIESERIKRCAELFIGEILPEEYVAFRFDERHNLKFEMFHQYGWEISYNEYDLFNQQYLYIDEYLELHQDLNEYLGTENNGIKYTVLTSIFNGYEILKDPEEVDPNAEYICVTDDRNLKSSVWKIIYDEELANSSIEPIQKSFIVKYHKIFDYVSPESKYVIRLDGSIQIHKSLQDIVRLLDSNGYDCLLMLHPERHHLLDEYDTWQSLRNQDPIFKTIFMSQMNSLNFKDFDCGLIETTLQIYKNNDICRQFVKDIDKMQRTVSYADNNDQGYYTYVYGRYKDKLNVLFTNRQIISSKYMDLCFHCTNDYVYKNHSYATNPGGEFIYDINVPMSYSLFGRSENIQYFL